jgi:ubiquinone/menaquinone biosynthesis C-methylase UbiE
VLRERFLAQIPTGGFILDAGCGSGRDSLAFLQRKQWDGLLLTPHVGVDAPNWWG